MKTVYTHSADETYTAEKILRAAGYTPAGRTAGKKLFINFHTDKQIMIIEKIAPSKWND